MKIEAFQVPHQTFRNCAAFSLHIVVNIGNGVLFGVCVRECVCGWHCLLCSLITFEFINGGIVLLADISGTFKCHQWIIFRVWPKYTVHHTTHNKQEPTPSHFCHFIAKNSALYMTCIITHWQQHHPKMKSYFYLHSEYRHHLLIPYIECINTWLLFSLFSSRGSGWAVGVKGLCFMRLFIITQCDSFIIHSLFVPCSMCFY